MSFPCPVCGQSMHAETRYQITLLRCESCGSVTVPKEDIQPWRREAPRHLG